MIPDELACPYCFRNTYVSPVGGTQGTREAYWICKQEENGEGGCGRQFFIHQEYHYLSDEGKKFHAFQDNFLSDGITKGKDEISDNIYIDNNDTPDVTLDDKYSQKISDVKFPYTCIFKNRPPDQFFRKPYRISR